MTFRTLIRRSLRYHARAHLGVMLGAAVGSAALVGALVVGDSVSVSLRDMALSRLGRTQVALAGNDRFFRARLAAEIGQEEHNPCAAVLQLPGTAASEDASARANQVQILGVDASFWPLALRPPALAELPADGVALNQPLAQQLKAAVGSTVLLRVAKPSLLSREAPISPQEDTSIALRLKVCAVLADDEFGRFSLRANQIAPFNAFVNLARLQSAVGQTNRANLLLLAGAADKADAANRDLRKYWRFEDAGLSWRNLPKTGGGTIQSDRIFLDLAVVDAARAADQDARPFTTYFVNFINSPPFATPYSMVTAIGAPVTPPDMKDDEILLNDWLAADLEAKPGETISLAYFVMGNGRELIEKHHEFKVRGIIPRAGPGGDRELMPEFPGLAQAESSRDWDAGFPIQTSRIRPKDEQYWKEFRGTPKAFVTLAAGENMWSNRFGVYTGVQFPTAATAEKIRDALWQKLDPASVGLAFQPVRAEALAASSQAVDFGGLFIGFSFFLIVAALLLMALLFQFGLEARASEIGLLLALGFRPAQVRRLLLGEGTALALIGGGLGAAGGTLYARAMLRGLTTVWKDAVGTQALTFHASAQTLTIGATAGAIVAILTLWFALRRVGKRPARELLAEGAVESPPQTAGRAKRGWGVWIGGLGCLGGIGLSGWALWVGDKASADTFFSAGALILIGGLGLASGVLRGQGAVHRPGVLPPLSLGQLGWRGCTRRRKRSLATIGLLASGIFLIVAIGAFRLDANPDALKRASGTGGFALIGETTIPIAYDLNRTNGRDFYGLNGPEMKFAKVVQFRVRDGDEASCLNLNRAQKPRVLGVDPKLLDLRKSFTFAAVQKGAPADKGWRLLERSTFQPPLAPDEVPAIADENSILWALDKKLGDTLEYTDEAGRPFKLRLVGALANSILQGNLIIDEAEFVKRFPRESGYRLFLTDIAPKDQAAVSASLTRALRDAGMEVRPAAARLNEFNAVQNTYLAVFQVLGGLGLLLGSAGLGIVVLRNIQERRGELALMLALGFRRGDLQRLLLVEHGWLLALGLVVGTVAAAVGILPALLSPGSHIPFLPLGLTLGGVLLNGLIWTRAATGFALRGKLLDALRTE